MKRVTCVLAALLAASPLSAQERLSMVLFTGDKTLSKSPLLTAHAFKTVPGANYFAVIAGPKTYFHTAYWFHSTMGDFGRGPQSTGGWLGFTWDGVEYFPSSMPLKPAMGVTAYAPFSGDSAGGFSEWMWSWDGVLTGQCKTGRTYREKNLSFASTHTGAESAKRFIIDFRGTSIHSSPLTVKPPYHFAEVAITRYRKDFSIPNALGKCRDHRGVDSSGVPTIVIGLYHPSDPERTKEILRLVDPLLMPESYIVEIDRHEQIAATQDVAGRHRVYPLAAVSMDGSMGGVPCFTPQTFTAWLSANDFQEVFFSCNHPASGKDDCVDVCESLKLLLQN